METKDYLKILKEEIHSTVIATVDREGLPVARVIDIMLVDDNSTIYFNPIVYGYFKFIYIL